MLRNHEEYAAMFEAEETLWWYRILHEKVVEAMVQRYGLRKDIAILDAGCGTGGLLTYLQKQGYTNLHGFDYSSSAVAFARQRGFNVVQLSITEAATHYSPQAFDCIISNDVIYALSLPDIEKSFQQVANLLKESGIFISNNNAFRCFYGTHDIAVGGKHRFTRSEINAFAKPVNLSEKAATYWSLLLSPLILVVRQWQQFQIRYKLVDTEKVTSDVEVPPSWVNNLFYQAVRLEGKLIKQSPFGSSLFSVFVKNRRN